MAAQVEPGNWNCDDDSPNQRADETENSKPAIEFNVCAERQPIRTKDFQKAHAPGANHQAEQSTNQHEEDGFHHHLFHDMPTACAHRLSDRHFLRTAARSNKNEIHQIDRADEEEKEHTRLNQEQRRANRADVLAVKRHHPRPKAGLGHHLRLRVGFLDFGIV